MTACSRGWNLNKQLFFYRLEPDFFCGRRPLFEPWEMLSSCGA